MFTLPEGKDYESLRRIQKYCYDNSAAKGFHDEGDQLRETVAGLVPTDPGYAVAVSSLRNYYGNNLMLIAGEVAEAHEELRLGHDMSYEYVNEHPGKEGKPEGVPSELADIVIRALDLAAETNVDLAAVIEGKLAYNATRERMHGKNF